MIHTTAFYRINQSVFCNLLVLLFIHKNYYLILPSIHLLSTPFPNDAPLYTFFPSDPHFHLPKKRFITISKQELHNPSDARISGSVSRIRLYPGESTGTSHTEYKGAPASIFFKHLPQRHLRMISTASYSFPSHQLTPLRAAAMIFLAASKVNSPVSYIFITFLTT